MSEHQLGGIDEVYGTMCFGPSQYQVETEDTLIPATEDPDLPSQPDPFVEGLMGKIGTNQDLSRVIADSELPPHLKSWKRYRTNADNPWSQAYSALCDEIPVVTAEFEHCKVVCLENIYSYLDTLAELTQEHDSHLEQQPRERMRAAEARLEKAQNDLGQSGWRAAQLNDRFDRLAETYVHEVDVRDFAPTDTTSDVGRYLLRRWPSER